MLVDQCWRQRLVLVGQWRSVLVGFDACSACGEEMIWLWEKEEVACGGEAIWSWKEEEEEEEDKGVLKRVESWVEKDQIVWYDVR